MVRRQCGTDVSQPCEGACLDRMPAGATSPGDYTWEVLILDAFQGGSGYSVEIPFTVTE